jgi:hypothetical protein
MMRRAPENADARFVACPACDGEGGREVGDIPTWDDPYRMRWETCDECDGGGFIEDMGLDAPDIRP